MKKKRNFLIALTLSIAVFGMCLPGKITLADTYGMVGSGTAADPYVVATAQQLENLDNVSPSAYYKLGCNIDLSTYGTNWIPIATFTGNFDGAGYSVKNLGIGTSASPYYSASAGLFATCGGNIENLNVSGTLYVTYNSPSGYCGLIAGQIVGVGGSTIKVKNCTSSGSITFVGTSGTGYVSNGAQVGGIIGGLNETQSGVMGSLSITNCSSNMQISATNVGTVGPYVGGIIGEVNSSAVLWTTTIDSCSTSGSITANNSACEGGIAGLINYCAINNCSSAVSLSGYTSYAGGICGQLSTGMTVTKCTNSGTVAVQGGAGTGGIVGYNQGIISQCVNHGDISISTPVNSSGCGGIVGYLAQNGQMSECYNAGAVTGGMYEGGAIGYTTGASIKNCYSTGDVQSAGEYTGAFCGFLYGSSTIYNCYVVATDTDGAAGFVGYVYGTVPYGSPIQNCYTVKSEGNAFIYTGASISYPVFIDCYFCTINKNPASGWGELGETQSYMQSSTFLSMLNTNLTSGTLKNNGLDSWGQSASINSGYPYLVGVGVGSDTTPPAGSYSLSKSAWTCKPVKITVTATDAGSGVASIMRPDNSVVSAATATYTVTDNGTYNFTLADNAGNTCTYPVTVSNIDKAVSVTHEQTVAYTIDPDSSTLSGGAITLTNNDPHIGVAVYLNSLSTSGIAAVAPDAIASWNALNTAQSASSMAIAVGVSNAADANWYSVAHSAPAYSTDLASPVLIGIIKPGSSVTLNVSAKYGLAWASQKAVTHTLALSYQACDTD